MGRVSLSQTCHLQDDCSQSFLVAQCIKDLELSLALARAVQCWFNPWPGNFGMLQVQPKKKKMFAVIW